MSKPTFPCESCGTFHSASEVSDAGGYCPQCDADYDERKMFADLVLRYTDLEAELAKLRAGQEPVAFRKPSVLKGCNVRYSASTAPQPNAVPDGCKLVPVELTETMILRCSVLEPVARRVWRELLAAAPSAPATAQGDGWIPVSERLPESERTVLAFYLNSHGKGRRVRAEYIAAKTKSADDGWDSDEPADYDEQADEYFWPAGWYEVMDNWDDLTHMVIHEGEVTHWMPLPAAPGAAIPAPKADDPVKVQLLEALEYFVSRKAAILAKFDIHGPADIAAGMRIKLGKAEAAIAAARKGDGV